jgi:tetratricopeptide (TPR) repeat protein
MPSDLDGPKTFLSLFANMLDPGYSDLFSVFGIFLCIQSLWQLYQRKSRARADSVTADDQSLAQRLALFVGVPLGVLLHELGHSLATWQLGGTVETFQWRFMWGYIIPSGDFSPAGMWWIAFSGNLVSILLGLLPLLWLPRIRQRFRAEIVYNFICVQLAYALVAYPLLSLLSRQGDWAYIYNFDNFSIEPYAALTLAAHIGLLLSLRQRYHSRRVLRWRLARDPQVLEPWKNLEAQVALEPDNLQSRLDLLYFLLNYQELHQAKRVNRQIQRLARDDNRVQVAQVAIAYSRRDYGQVLRTGRRLLSFDLSAKDRLHLYRLLTTALYNLHRPSEALNYADQGLAADPEDFRLRCTRAILYQTMKRRSEAQADLEIALKLAPNEEGRLWVAKMLSDLAS